MWFSIRQLLFVRSTPLGKEMLSRNRECYLLLLSFLMLANKAEPGTALGQTTALPEILEQQRRQLPIYCHSK